jgi:hypothetical protein
MPEDKRRFEFNHLLSGFPELVPSIEEQDETVTNLQSALLKKGSYFNKELVLRLIDWLEGE